MAAKSKQRAVRVPSNVIKYVTGEGERLSIPVLPGNTPHISAVHTGKDEEFLGANRGKLQKLQRIFA